MIACPGLEAFGLDISAYALTHCEPATIGRLHLGTMEHLPFPGRSFDAVSASIPSTIWTGKAARAHCGKWFRIVRDPAKCFVQVDAYRSEAEKKLFESWCLTAETYLGPAEWVALFQQAGYSGDYYWTILGAKTNVL